MGEKGDKKNLFKAFKLYLEQKEKKELKEEDEKKKTKKIVNVAKLGAVLTIAFFFKFLFYVIPKKREEKQVDIKKPTTIANTTMKLEMLKEKVKKTEEAEKLIELRDEMVTIYKDTKIKNATKEINNLNKKAEKEIKIVDKKIDDKNPNKIEPEVNLGSIIVPVLSIAENVITEEKKKIEPIKPKEDDKFKKKGERLKELKELIKNEQSPEKLNKYKKELEELKKETDKIDSQKELNKGAEKELTNINEKFANIAKIAAGATIMIGGALTKQLIKEGKIEEVKKEQAKAVAKKEKEQKEKEQKEEIQKEEEAKVEEEIAITKEEEKKRTFLKEKKKKEEVKLENREEAKFIDEIKELNLAADRVQLDIFGLNRHVENTLLSDEESKTYIFKGLLKRLSKNIILSSVIFQSSKIRTLVKSLSINNTLRALRNVNKNDHNYIDIEYLRDMRYTKGEIYKYANKTFDNSLYQISALRTEIFQKYGRSAYQNPEMAHVLNELGYIEGTVHLEMEKIDKYTNKAVKNKVLTKY